MIQVFKPYYNNEEIEAVTDVIKSGWVGLGPKTAVLSKKVAWASWPIALTPRM